MEQITFNQLIGTVVVVLILCGAYNTIMTSVKHSREEKKYRETPFTQLKTTVENHELRLQKLETASSVNATENKLMMRMLLALTRHAIDGNNIHDLQSMRDEVNDYLVNK